MPRYYTRFQPIGLSLLLHTSEASDDSLLPSGSVFAYDEPEHAFSSEGPLGGGWVNFDPDKYEAITFTGRLIGDPGDVEGVAVVPTTEVRRESIQVKHTGYSHAQLDPILANCRAGGLIRSNKLRCTEGGQQEFWLDACVAKGLMRKSE